MHCFEREHSKYLAKLKTARVYFDLMNYIERFYCRKDVTSQRKSRLESRTSCEDKKNTEHWHLLKIL